MCFWKHLTNALGLGSAYTAGAVKGDALGTETAKKMSPSQRPEKEKQFLSWVYDKINQFTLKMPSERKALRFLPKLKGIDTTGQRLQGMLKV